MLIKNMKFSMPTKACCCMKFPKGRDEDKNQNQEGLSCATFFTRKLGTQKPMTALRRAFSGNVSHRGIKKVPTEHGWGFSCDSDIYLRIVTWNMNGQVVDEDIEKLVGGDMKYDLLVIGLQEAPSKKISHVLESALVNTHILLGKAIMQSLQLYVFGLKDSEQFVGELKVDKQSVGGLGGLIGRKKGAVAIFITYKGIPIQLISCHLAAHARNVEERNDQCKHISHSLFSEKWDPPYAKHAQVTIWLGDLNYRLEGINTFPARDLIHDNLHELLTEKDQLLQEAERGNVFKGYCEGNLAFKPTYKYNKGSSFYDTSHKVRVPSWTDRILFKIEDQKRIDASLHCYESMDNIRSSDHKPVKAHLCLTVKN